VAVQFPQTDWSLLLALHSAEGAAQRDILERLLQRYWRPVYCFVRACGGSSAGAPEDLTQEFFTHMLSHGHFEKLSPERGSFRGFLKTAVRNFVGSAGRVARNRVRLFSQAEAEAAWQGCPELRPDEAFDRAWSRSVLREAVALLERDMRNAGRERAFALFQSYSIDRTDDVTYQALAQRFEMSEHDVRNRLREVRQQLREILRKLVREYLAPGDDVEAELKFILGQ
jgi:RNA polymerase sigma factor (sigma-70 family)